MSLWEEERDGYDGRSLQLNRWTNNTGLILNEGTGLQGKGPWTIVPLIRKRSKVLRCSNSWQLSNAQSHCHVQFSFLRVNIITAISSVRSSEGLSVEADLEAGQSLCLCIQTTLPRRARVDANYFDEFPLFSIELSHIVNNNKFINLNIVSNIVFVNLI